MINWQAIRKEHLAGYTGIYLNSPANGLPSRALYDAETHHSLRVNAQQRWESKIAAELELLSCYQQNTIIKQREVVARQ